MTTMPATTPMPRRVRNLRFLTVLQIAALVVLFSAGALQEARHLQSLTDPSVWLQLRTGNWILDHHSVPRSGLFSRFDALRWTDSNWGSQVILAALYRTMGLRALPAMQMAFRILVAIATFLLAGGRRGGFWLAAVLSICAQTVIFHSLTQSLLFSAVLFSMELWLLFTSRATGRQGLLSWMPLLVLVWANMDWHFVFGLLVLLLFLCAVAVEQALGNKMYAHAGARLALGRVAMIAVASCIASLLSPYSYHSYSVAWQNCFGTTVLALTPEMKAMNFRAPEHYLLMLLAMFAFLALGRQHAKDPFKVMLLAVSASAGFSFQREAWMIVVASVAILGDVFFPAGGRPDEPSHTLKPVFWAAAAIALIVLVAAASHVPSRTETLLEVTAQKLPVRACDFIRQNHLPAPIYNELSWGDFLIWYLPNYPVSMDDRYELYGEENVKLYYQASAGSRLPSQYPALASANTILISADNGLVRVPQMFPNAEEVFHTALPGFQQVYRDDLAVVLSKQR